ncbi:MAG: Rrf2 family transcriptional regulator [Bacteroidales bacterium]|jgi:Rrf2 family iron-sulfur cluster assembly transcriptional regulator|nr:Rrf2 family transcriptional regulator [Bacteroidales bacterium]MDD3702266.1 Rrf2 family transcriptional regulator [Bacteroidales bacterium]MDY0368859.1 Rrf2 family transcriptional regulator [Bacteroidales bacterium]
MVSKACEHGIRAVIYIAAQSFEGKRAKIADIVQHSGSPEAFTAKVLGELTKHRIIQSHTGPRGGFEMNAEKLKTIHIGHIVQAIDGEALYINCGLGLSQCNAMYPCPVHDKYVIIRNEIKEMHITTTIFELAMAYRSGKTVLSR